MNKERLIPKNTKNFPNTNRYLLAIIKYMYKYLTKWFKIPTS